MRDKLRQRGLSAIIPSEVRWRQPVRLVRRWVPYDRPVFSRYVFVHQPTVLLLMDLPFVHGLLSLDGKPYSLSPREYDYIREFPDLPEPHERIRRPAANYDPSKPRVGAGQKVRVSGGPLAGQAGMVGQVYERKQRALVDFLGSFGLVEIPLAQLEAA